MKANNLKKKSKIKSSSYHNQKTQKQLKKIKSEPAKTTTMLRCLTADSEAIDFFFYKVLQKDFDRQTQSRICYKSFVTILLTYLSRMHKYVNKLVKKDL